MTSKTTDVDLGAILALLQDVKAGQDGINQRLGALEERVDSTENSLPQFVPMENANPSEGSSPNEVMARLGKNGQIDGTLKSIRHDDTGRPLGDALLAMRPPTYQKGQQVRINPQAARDGFPEGVTWAQRLARFRSDGVGVVRDVLHLARKGEWRYTVRFQGIGGVNGLLDVDDHELLPA